jgi:hypothetical protein
MTKLTPAKTSITTAIALVLLYVYTLAPDIVEGDSANFVLAAKYWGIGHPTSYPLWCILSAIFVWLSPFSAAYTCNLTSALYMAIAGGIGTNIILKWIGPDRPWKHFVAAISFLFWGITQAVWSQAIIAEVYALHTLLGAIALWTATLWIKNPNNKYILIHVLILGLSLSNHHLTLTFFCLLPLAAIFFHPKRAIQITTAMAAGLGSAYMALTLASESADVIAGGLFLATATALAWILAQWFSPKETRPVAWAIPFIFWLGLIPYIYTPLAAGQSPNNWTHTQSKEGFFHTLNRTQFEPPLTKMFANIFGFGDGKFKDLKINPEAETARPPAKSPLQFITSRANQFAHFFPNYPKLLDASLPLLTLGCFGILIVFLHNWKNKQADHQKEAGLLLAWTCLIAFLYPLAAWAEIRGITDRELFRPFQSLPIFLLVTTAAYGVSYLGEKFPATQRLQQLGLTAALILCFADNFGQCSQRGDTLVIDRVRDMQNRLPKNAILLTSGESNLFPLQYINWIDEKKYAKNEIIGANLLTSWAYGYHRRNIYEKKETKKFRLETDVKYPEPNWWLVSQTIAAQQKRPVREVAAQRIWKDNKETLPIYSNAVNTFKWGLARQTPLGPIIKIEKEPTPITEEIIRADTAYWEGQERKLSHEPHYTRNWAVRENDSSAALNAAYIYFNRRDQANQAREIDLAKQLEETAVDRLKTSLALFPGNALATWTYCSYLRGIGKEEEAKSYAETGPLWQFQPTAAKKIQTLFEMTKPEDPKEKTKPESP